MMISELIEQLQDALDNEGDREVLLATQPSWPLAFEVSGTYVPEAEQMDEPCASHDAEVCGECNLEDSPLWIVQGEHPDNPYAPKDAWR